MKPLCLTIQMKAIEQYFRVVLFIMLYQGSSNFFSVDENLVCVNLSESYWAALAFDAVIMQPVPMSF